MRSIIFDMLSRVMHAAGGMIIVGVGTTVGLVVVAQGVHLLLNIPEKKKE